MLLPAVLSTDPSISVSTSGRSPDAQSDQARGLVKIAIGGEHQQSVPHTKLSEQRVDRADLQTLSPARIAQFRRLDVVAAIGND